jgi:hypothetical protein
MDALAAGVDEGRAGQFQLPDDGLLLAQLHVVAFHKGIAIGGDVGVFAAGAVHGVEADPGTHLRVPVAQHLAEIPAAGAQFGKELPGGAGPAALGRAAFVVGHETLGDIGHILVLFKQGLQVAPELVHRVPLFRQGEIVGFHPTGVYQLAVCVVRPGGDVVVPVQRMARRAAPPVGVGHLEDAAHRDGAAPAAVEALPFFDTLALVVAAGVPRAPLLPDGDRQAAVLEGHAHRDPLVIGQGGRAEKFQRFFEIVFMFHVRYHPKSVGTAGCASGVKVLGSTPLGTPRQPPAAMRLIMRLAASKLQLPTCRKP